MLPNRNYKELMKDCNHRGGVIIDSADEKLELPVHIISGAYGYFKIKTDAISKVGKPGQPIAIYTQLGLTIMSPVRESGTTNILLTKNSECDHINFVDFVYLVSKANRLEINKLFIKNSKISILSSRKL